MDPLPAPAPTRLRRAAWAWPLVLAFAFAGAFGAWLQWSDAQEAEDTRHIMIADALTLDSRISDWLDDEHREATRLAQALPADVDEAVLLREPTVAAGLRRLWLSATVLDAHNRILAHLPDQVPRPVVLPQQRGIDERGLSAHLAAPTRWGGELVVQFDPGALLRQTVPWWLGRKYDVRLIDGLGQVIAATGAALAPAGRQSYRVSVEPAMNDTYLELTTREAGTPWWRRLPLALMAAFLLLSGAASWMLRRQMREVASAETRWRTEAAWRRAIEDSLTVGLRGRDADGRLVHVNRAFCDLVGFSPEQLLGRMPPMPYWPHDAVAESMQRHRRNLAGNAPREGYEARWVRGDGRAIDVMIFEAPLVDAQGRQNGWMGSIVDISARKQAEERERRRAETLATQARLTTLGEVASALAHQLNQPLAAIAGYGGGVLRSLERSGYDEPMVLDALRRLGEQAAEAGRIVQRIRAFLTRRAPQRESCEVPAIALRAIALLRRDLQRQGIAVETALAPDLPPVFADPVLVEQVLINLLRNAADALAGGNAPRIRVAAEAEGERLLRIAVDDNGPGLGGLGIEVLSAPFHSTKPEGMGMGLAICRSVVEAHHGGLEAGPSPLGGARFSFTLPVTLPVTESPPT